MRARYPQPITTEAEIRNKLKTYIAEEKEKIYNSVSVDVMAQTLAIVLSTLELNYGWRKKRLTKLMCNIMAYAEMASNDNFNMNAIDLVRNIKKNYGIDTLEKSRKLYGGYLESEDEDL